MLRPNRAILTAVTLLFVAASSQAAWYNPLSWFRKDAPHTLIVTGNYVQSRVLAELIQYHTKYPVLFLPAAGTSDNLYMLHFNGESMSISRDRYKEFVYTLRPKTVLFLGNTAYTPQHYIDQLGNDVTVTVVRNDNWHRIAQSVADQLSLPKLPRQFEQQMKHFDDRDDIIKDKGVEAARRKFNPGETPAASPDPR